MAQTRPQAAAATPEAGLSRLAEGNARYVANQPRLRDFSAARASTELGQAPFAAILGCADSIAGFNKNYLIWAAHQERWRGSSTISTERSAAVVAIAHCHLGNVRRPPEGRSFSNTRETCS